MSTVDHFVYWQEPLKAHCLNLNPNKSQQAGSQLCFRFFSVIHSLRSIPNKDTCKVSFQELPPANSEVRTLSTACCACPDLVMRSTQLLRETNGANQLNHFKMDFIDTLHWFAAATDRISRLSQKVD